MPTMTLTGSLCLKKTMTGGGEDMMGDDDFVLGNWMMIGDVSGSSDRCSFACLLTRSGRIEQK